MAGDWCRPACGIGAQLGGASGPRRPPSSPRPAPATPPSGAGFRRHPPPSPAASRQAAALPPPPPAPRAETTPPPDDPCRPQGNCQRRRTRKQLTKVFASFFKKKFFFEKEPKNFCSFGLRCGCPTAIAFAVLLPDNAAPCGFLPIGATCAGCARCHRGAGQFRRRASRPCASAAFGARRPPGRGARRADVRAAPARVLPPDDPPFRLTLADERAAALAELGVTLIYQLPFDAAFSAMPASAFVEQVLHAGVGAQHLASGPDFAFGHRRGGDVDFLAQRWRRSTWA